MTFDPQDDPKLSKLGVKTLAGLALIAPKKYENRFLAHTPLHGEVQTIKVEVEHVARGGQTLRLKFYSPTFERTLQGVIFHPKPYQKAQFSVGKRLYLQGKMEFNPPFLQIIHPKVLSSINTIEPLYDTPLATNTLKALLKKYLTRENLSTLGYDSKVTEDLWLLHHPNETITSLEPFIPTLKFVEMSQYLLGLQRHRRFIPVSPLAVTCVTPFISSLPFSLTDDQKHVIKEIEEDLAKPIQTKRMIIGDVGCGKTMVILASAFMASPSKSVILAPTSLLATQLYEEAQKFLPMFPIALVTQKTKSQELQRSLQEATLIIGTHALLYTSLPPISLLIIDEQHRFGTAQRNALASLSNNPLSPPHILQFSATPIPRTQAMIQSALIDVSFIRQIPFKKTIHTHIITTETFPLLMQHIDTALQKKEQVIIVYPLVEASETMNYQSLEEAKGYWIARYPDVMITHGKDKEKEEVLTNFRAHGRILLTTTLIEVGISLPLLTTIVVVGAERLGLATLHQLRGRVGRGGGTGDCFLFTKSQEITRLKEFCQTTNGFEIAELDLRYRQSGDLLIGKEQSGKSFTYIDMATDEEIIDQAKEWVENIKSQH